MKDPGQLRARRTVHHAMVDLADHGESPLFEAFDDPEFPERTTAVENPGRYPRRQLLEFLHPARTGKRGVANVVVEIEMGVVHPDRALLERHPQKLLPIAGNFVQATFDELPDLPDLDASPFRRHVSAFVDGDGRDVQGRVDVLGHQETVVLGRQALVGITGQGGRLPGDRLCARGLPARADPRRTPPGRARLPEEQVSCHAGTLCPNPQIETEKSKT